MPCSRRMWPHDRASRPSLSAHRGNGWRLYSTLRGGAGGAQLLPTGLNTQETRLEIAVLCLFTPSFQHWAAGEWALAVTQLYSPCLAKLLGQHILCFTGNMLKSHWFKSDLLVISYKTPKLPRLCSKNRWLSGVTFWESVSACLNICDSF